MFPMDFDKLTREAFAHVATDRNKWNPSGDLGPEAAAFLATDCGIPMVLFVEWPAGGTVRADVYAPAGKGGPSLWQCIRVADTRYVTLLYPLGETGGHLVAAKQAPIHTSSSSAYEAVMVERIRQDAKYGTADYADVDPTLTRQGDVASMPERVAAALGIPTAAVARASNKARHGNTGNAPDTWAHILVEEVAEAIEAATLAEVWAAPEDEVDRELVQVAAVAIAWLQARARRNKVAAKQQRNLDAFCESLAAKAEAMGDLGDTRLTPEFIRSMLDSDGE